MSTHLDAAGNAIMVDIAQKSPTRRLAVAEGYLSAAQEAVRAIRDNSLMKGDALAVSRVAGIMAAKNTSRTIPLCHDIPLSSCTVDFEVGETEIRVVCSVACTAGTGAEMEALSGVTTALLTLYDMAKAIDRGMTLGRIRLLHKSGGKSGEYHADADDR